MFFSYQFDIEIVGASLGQRLQSNFHDRMFLGGICILILRNFHKLKFFSFDAELMLQAIPAFANICKIKNYVF
jgi:hypothetical protein